MSTGFPNIYEYFDFRQWLKDAYEARKASNKTFSYRSLAKKAGYSSPAFFTKIIQGSSNISETMALKLAEAFRIRRHELEYFLTLVHYCQATSHQEKCIHFEKLLSTRRTHVQTLEQEQFELFSHWYFVAIREALDFMVVTDHVDDLSQILWPPISHEQTLEALRVLTRLGLVRKSPNGIYERVETALSTGEQWQSFAIAEFQRSMMEHALQSMDSTPRHLRDYSTLTLSISSESLERIKGVLKDTRRVILEIARADRATDRVMQMNFQLFPLTRVEDM